MRLMIKRLIFISLILSFAAFGNICAFAETESVAHSSSAIDVNGTEVEIEGYNIEGNNYFKLRDIAAALSETNKNFQVEYDKDNDRVVITAGKNYEPDGTENFEAEDPDNKQIKETVSEVYFGENKIELKAYNVDGYNYVKLRDVASMMDFALMYYGDIKEVSFVTDKKYAESKEFYPEDPNSNPAPDDGNATPDSSGLYSTEIINDYSMYFYNYVDGYKIMASKDMNIDMSFSEFRTVLEKSDLRIEIYRQQLSSGGYNSYVNYGNRFISDSSTYTKVENKTITVAGHSARLLEWYRKPLAKVANDKCYYASVDVKINSSEVLTLLFKSSAPFDVSGGSKSYINILNTLSLTQQSVKAVNRQTQTIENKNWNEETAALYKKYFSADSQLTWGIFEPAAPYDMTQLKATESRVEGKFKFLVYYTNINSNIEKLQTILANAAAEGRTVELTLQTVANSDGNGNMLMDALDGKHDDFLNQYAKAVAESGKPVLFRLCNEMNGDWCMYSAYHTSKDTSLYVEFYKYVYSIFEKNGALKNTIWVWNPNERSYPYYDWNHALCYYPGDQYVDVVGLTGYNTGTYHQAENWRSFATIYDTFYYQYCSWFSQPLMITEFACSSYGGDKAQWVNDMFAKINDYSRIKVAIWWDGCDYDSDGNIARAYFIDDNEGVLDAFKNYFNQHKEITQNEADSTATDLDKEDGATEKDHDKESDATEKNLDKEEKATEK